MDEKKTDVGTRERADVDDVGQDTTRGERGLGMEEMPAEITFDIVEEAFVPLDEGMEPDRRELVAGRVEAEYAKVNGFSAVTQAKRALINGMSTVTIGEKAKVTGFSPVVVTSQKATVKKGAAVLAVAGHEVKLKDHGYVGIALAPRIQVDEGGRVLITPMVALLI
jgi:hypothetical protein